MREFVEAACVLVDGWHVDGDLVEANRLLAAHPELAQGDIYCAAILGEVEVVARYRELARVKGGPRNWDPLTYLCFSRYLRLDPSRSDGLLQSARLLLDAGADPATGFTGPDDVWECVLYGAAGWAHHEGLTRLLLEQGIDPNDGETPYHAPESYDNACLVALMDCGRLTPDSLAMMLLRKADWHHLDGVALCLERGADPNLVLCFGRTPFQHAVLRDNRIEILERFLDAGADPPSVLELAARRGRGDLLKLFRQRGIEVPETPLVACALGEKTAPAELGADGPACLAAFAGNGNVAGVSCLLDLGVGVNDVCLEKDGYYDVAPPTTALHVAAWRARPEVVKLLLARGAAPDAVDGKGRTPLALAVRACVDSDWTERRSPDSVAALLAAGARPVGPCGYAEVDRLLTGA